MSPVNVAAWLIESLLVDVDAGRITVADANRRIAEWVELEAIAAVVERECAERA